MLPNVLTSLVLSFCSSEPEMMIFVGRKQVFILTIFIAVSSTASMSIFIHSVCILCCVAITEGPVSVSALVGENVQFHSSTQLNCQQQWIVHLLLLGYENKTHYHKNQIQYKLMLSSLMSSVSCVCVPYVWCCC